ncbi:unnamed protein product [Coffea canephora]|uniref:Glutaredoxin domain-containing protein n=2 Tax=Coffea TaxID=13442 RepID=A0A068UMI5_COFCA|nr:unnamed protein product [Coffea canephora]
MGCSASIPQAFISRDQPQQSQSSNFSSSSLSQSPHSNFSSSTPVSRTLSLPTPLVHHLPLCKGDTNHLVSLTSTTYGSLVLVDPPKPNFDAEDFVNSTVTAQIVKPPNVNDSGDPLSPDSVINTWELMEGLDELDFDVVDPPGESPKKPILCSKSKTFDLGSMTKDFDANELERSYEFVEHSDSKPLWQHLSEESLLAKLDPNVVSSYRKALLSKQFGGKEAKEWLKSGKIQPIGSPNSTSFCSKRSDIYLSGAEDRVVLYYTSLRGIRKTYEECCTVRMIFRGFRVCVDERDMSMDSSYRKELQSLLGGKTVTLPQVFIKGMYIGGAEEIKELHEEGELAVLLDGIPVKDSRFVCESCGDARFVPCSTCNGSRKIFEEEEGKLRRCFDCNENGLVRCPSCCP